MSSLHLPVFAQGTLQRRLFRWFSLTILATVVVVSMVSSFLNRSVVHRRELERPRTFLANHLVSLWNDPAQRDALASSVSKDFDLEVVLKDTKRQPLARFGATCSSRALETPILREETVLGFVTVCSNNFRPPPFSSFRWVLPLIITGLALWVSSGILTRRLGRPLFELAHVASEIGAGNLSARVKTPRGREQDEEALVARVLNTMASRVQAQIENQKALLAAVSHEIRSPLARIRLLTELARAGDASTLDQIDQEITDLDDLVSELLASSRLDFAAIQSSPLDAMELATRALEASRFPLSLLQTELSSCPLQGDPTLLLRALRNLLENARHHGGGPLALRVRREGALVRFEVEDQGPGLTPGEEARIFEPFFRDGKSPQSVGLGLTLVRRISQAHGGDASARNRSEGGACIGFSARAG